MTDSMRQEPPMDGRSMRSVRTRRSVIEAFLDLLNEGVESPTSQQIADRSGVSPSTIFRLFEDLDGMYVEAQRIQSERVADLLAPIPPVGTVAQRVERQVRARARLYEKVAPIRRFQSRVTSRSPSANRAAANCFFRGQIATLFAGELSAAPDGTLDMIDAFTSWEVWERLRSIQGLTVKQAERMVKAWVDAALDGSLR